MTVRRNQIVVIILAVVVILTAAQIASARTAGTGFPLDDAWIHQTYARNLAQRGEWSFLPGHPSGGSTAPLWSLLLAAGQFSGQPPFVYTYILGGLCLAGLAVVGERFLRRQSPAYRAVVLPVAGLFLAGEWHLAWAAASGMETILQALLVVLVFMLLTGEKIPALLVGAVIGVSTWVRPDGLTLLGPAGFVLWFAHSQIKQRGWALARLAAGFLLIFLPYLAFNWMLTGTPWPNTFYAKQAEYVVIKQMGLPERLGSLLSLPLVGAGVLLLPGAVFAAGLGWRERRPVLPAALIWWLGYSLIYALLLPVTYQHGRYLMPAMPAYFLAGLAGAVELLARWKGRGLLTRVVKKVWVGASAAVWLGFAVMGVFTYAGDVAIINTEMVKTAQWVADELPGGALVAAHDIGALGYYGSHELVDLAGLISPEVIPFIRDEARLGRYLNERGVEYLVTFPGWYSDLTRGKAILYTSEGRYAPAAGGENMSVFRWSDP